MDLFYENIWDAISRMVHGNPLGLSIKQIAMSIWPSRNPDTARSALSRCINPEYNDMNLSPEELETIMLITECPEHIIYYLCDRFGFERPIKKTKANFEKQINSQLKNLQEQINQMSKLLKQYKEISNNGTR